MHVGGMENVFNNVPYNWIVDTADPAITRICGRDPTSGKRCPLLKLDIWRRE